MRLGRTGLMISRSGFGALPLQRVPLDEACALLREAHDNDIDFFDTARAYTDSEEKIGAALGSVRNDVVIATKSHALDAKGVLFSLETSLRNLRTDHVDIFQLHNPDRLPDPDDPDGPYGGMVEAKKKGMIRFIGITNHRRELALEAARSGLYDTVQFPFSYLSSSEDEALVSECRNHDVGFIAMKALSGGLVSNVAATFAYLRQFEGVVPIWGAQRLRELREFIELEKNPPTLDESMRLTIEADRRELSGRVLPRLRLLPALSRGHTHPHGGETLIRPEENALAAVYAARVEAEDGEDSGLSRLRPLQGELSLRSRYAKASEKDARRVRGILFRARECACRREIEVCDPLNSRENYCLAVPLIRQVPRQFGQWLHTRVVAWSPCRIW